MVISCYQNNFTSLLEIFKHYNVSKHIRTEVHVRKLYSESAVQTRGTVIVIGRIENSSELSTMCEYLFFFFVVS